jgi:diguanylate cyclase (GGDEF)-like protein/putative nucleotidyltransferase with HDIG domain
MSSWSSLPARVKSYILGVVLTALPLFANALYTVTLKRGQIHDENWLILTGITLVTVPLFVFLPSVRSLVTIGDAFIIYICIKYGTSPAILANTLYMTFLTLLLRERHKTSAHRIVFNIACAVLTVTLYGSVYEYLIQLTSSSPPLHVLDGILIPTCGLALTYFLSNSFLVAIAIALTSQVSIFSIWYKNYLSISIDFLVSATAAALMVFLSNYHPILPVLAAPFVGAVWGINKTNHAKALEAHEHLRQQEALYLRTVESLALAVDAKDQTTYGHIRRVRAYSLTLAQLCGITDKQELMAIETGSLLHDIGKLAIEDYILNKPGRLTHYEFEKMKLHSAAGDEILKQIQFPFPVAQYVRSHHERWDGNGYPDGLSGTAIPLGARILAIADAFDAIRSSRPYKLSFGIQDSVELLRAQSGTLYDPELVAIFVNHIDELETAAQDAAKNVPELTFRRYFDHTASTPLAASTSLSDPQSPSAELVSLYEFCHTKASQLEIHDVLPIITDRLRRIVPYNTCTIFLHNNDDMLHPIYCAGEHASVVRSLGIPLGKGISGWVAAYKQPIFNSPPSLEFLEFSDAYQLLSDLTDVLIVPLILDGDCIGTLSLYARHPVQYNQPYLTLLQVAAKHIAPILRDYRSLASAPTDHDTLNDPVTHLPRAVYLSFAASALISAAKANRSPLTLVCIEIHNLHNLCRMYGPEATNRLLRNISSTIKSELRDTDVLVRYGAHEFIVLLPGVRLAQATRFASRFQQQIRSSDFASLLGINNIVICHTAVSSYPENGQSLLELLDASQQCLHHSTESSSAATDAQIISFPQP